MRILYRVGVLLFRGCNPAIAIRQKGWPCLKLSILDIKAVDANGAIYDIEMQLTIFDGLVQRVVFYGCEIGF